MKKYKNYLKNQKLRRENPSIRQIREGKVISEWVSEPYIPPVFISGEVKGNLKQFNKDNILYSSLFLDYAIYNERFGNKLPQEWRKLRDQVEKINELINMFNKKCWPDIHEKIKDLDYNSKYIYENSVTKTLAMSTAGRFLMTIQSYNEQLDVFVSILGLDGKEFRKCGLQGCRGLFNDIKNIILDVVNNWDKNKFVENENCVTIC